MSITLRVTTDVLKTKASELDTDIKALEKHFGTISDIILRTDGYWIGAAGDEGRKRFNESKAHVDKVIQNFKEHPTDLLVMAGIYDESEKAAISENQALTTDVIA